jgi:hypothetical protein
VTNYFQAVVDDLDELLPGNDPELQRFYALLVLVTGEATTLEDVHDAWAAWRSYTRPDHPDLMPFHELDEPTKERDRKYRDAVHTAAENLEARA